jgi:hypothetical protein
VDLPFNGGSYKDTKNLGEMQDSFKIIGRKMGYPFEMKKRIRYA